MNTLNRSALAVRPKQLFLDWLHGADPTSHEITLFDGCQEPTIYLIPECDTDEELGRSVLHPVRAGERVILSRPLALEAEIFELSRELRH